MRKSAWVMVCVTALSLAAGRVETTSRPTRARHGMVASEDATAAHAGLDVLREGGNAIDAAVATAFALAVTYPAAGNIGGGGFLVFRPSKGDPVAIDFRETAPAGSSPTMFLSNATYDRQRHHDGAVSAGVPGSVAGLHLAWRDHGRRPWRRLIEPAIRLARDGFPVSFELAATLRDALPAMRPYPASLAQFTRQGIPYEPGDILRQPDLARTLERIAADGPDGFYDGETARLIEQEMKARGGLIGRADLKAYRALTRTPLRGSYRGYDILSIPPASSGGTALLEMLNILEGYDLKASGFASADSVHLMAEAMRRAYADRARHLGDPAFNPDMPIDTLTSKDYAAGLRKSIRRDRASSSDPASFEWPSEGRDTTHLSVVDAERNAVALTTTLESLYGSKIVVSGAGFLLNNEMGDFNPAPGLTTAEGLIGTGPNLAAPGKRMLSSMSPTILARDGQLFMVTGTPGDRSIITTVLQTIVNVIDFGMNAQESVDAARVHHQWLPDRIQYERFGLAPDTLAILGQRGHALAEIVRRGRAQVIVVNPDGNVLEGGTDRRTANGTAAGY
jgi:gamma-glutamyltranspeptidase/glutathione hydrolase